MKKYIVISKGMMSTEFPDWKPEVNESNESCALSRAELLFGKSSVDRVIPVTDRSEDFLDKDLIKEYLESAGESFKIDEFIKHFNI
jgi:hypothetical protein